MTSNSRLDLAYKFCQSLSRRHYENFPVASFLLPKELRRPISVIYAFARTADDFADEGNDTIEIRLEKLNYYREELRHINDYGKAKSDNPIFIALADVIPKHQLPYTLFDDLLTAFIQDVNKTRYQNFEQVLEYCHYSANPVGRLLLHLNDHTDNSRLTESDTICTALQLINFYQDISQDYLEQDRIYLPEDELNKFNIEQQQLSGNHDTAAMEPLLRLQYKRVREILTSGIFLGKKLNGRFGWEIRSITLAAATVLNKLELQESSNMLSRPRLTRIELLMILLNSASKKRYLSAVTKQLN